MRYEIRNQFKRKRANRLSDAQYGFTLAKMDCQSQLIVITAGMQWPCYFTESYFLTHSCLFNYHFQNIKNVLSGTIFKVRYIL